MSEKMKCILHSLLKKIVTLTSKRPGHYQRRIIQVYQSCDQE